MEITPKEIANTVLTEFSNDMNIFTAFIFQRPSHVCRLCRDTMEIVKKTSENFGLSEEQIVEAVNIARPLYVKWLKEYIANGKFVPCEL